MIVQGDESGNRSLESLHTLWERIAQAFDDLKQRQIDIAKAASEDEPAAILFEHAFKIAEELRDAVAPEVPASPPRGRALLLEVKPTRDRMMGIVNSIHEIRNRELQLMRPQTRGFIARRKFQPRSEKQQYVRGLRDGNPARLQKRRRIGRARRPPVRHELRHGRQPGFAAPRNIDVISAGFFQRQANKLTAALDRWPVVELITHEL